MQPAAGPELLALLRLVVVALGQPGRPQYQLALRGAIRRQETAIGGLDRRVHQHHRHARLEVEGAARVLVGLQQFVVDVRPGDQRAGLGHAVGGDQIHTGRLCLVVEAAGQRAAADGDFPALEVGALGGLGIEQHLHDGRHAMGEGHLLAAPEIDQVLGVVAARINLFEAEHGGNVGQPPCMHVEHRCDRHVDVVRAHQPRIFPTADSDRRGQGVQHQLAMGEVHAFGVTGGAGGVEGRGDRILVEVREVVARRGGGQQAFVFADAVRQAGITRLAIGEQ